MSKVEFQVPTYLLLSDESNAASMAGRKKMAKIAIEDQNGDGRLDVKSESVVLNGVELNEKQKKDLFNRLGISRAQGADIDFAKKFFGRLSLIAEKVGQGKFRDVDDVDNALVRDEKDFLRPHAYGIETPCKFYRQVKDVAYDVAQRRARLEKGLCRLETMIARSDARYWDYSKGLKAGMQACGMNEQLELLKELDRKAYCNPTLRDCAS